MKYLLAITVFLFVGIVGSANAAVQSIGNGKIQWLENGWDGEGVAFKFSLPVSGGCTANVNEYAVSKDHPGYKEIVSILLAAQVSQSDVTLTVENTICLVGVRTKVMAVRIVK